MEEKRALRSEWQHAHVAQALWTVASWIKHLGAGMGHKVNRWAKPSPAKDFRLEFGLQKPKPRTQTWQDQKRILDLLAYAANKK